MPRRYVRWCDQDVPVRQIFVVAQDRAEERFLTGAVPAEDGGRLTRPRVHLHDLALQRAIVVGDRSVVEDGDSVSGKEDRVVLPEERPGCAPLDLHGVAVQHQQRADVAQREDQVPRVEQP
jgi:hypothetical protein